MTFPAHTKTISGDDMYLYLSINRISVRFVLVKEEVKGQVLIYYERNLFPWVDINNQEIEKYLYILFVSVRKLRPYFHAHDITVLTKWPLKHLL